MKTKILINEATLALNQDSKIDFNRPVIEADSENLYIFSPSGKVSNFSYDKFYGSINYKTQKLSFYSQHDVKSIDLKSVLSPVDESFNLPDLHAVHKGQILLSDFKFNNGKNISNPCQAQ